MCKTTSIAVFKKHLKKIKAKRKAWNAKSDYMKNNAIKVRERLCDANHSPRCGPKAVIQERVCVWVLLGIHMKK